MSKKLCWHARNFYRYLLYPYRAFIWSKYITYMARISPSSSAPKNDCKVLWNRTKNNMERLQLKYQLHNKETNRNPKKIISIIIAGHVLCLYNVILAVVTKPTHRPPPWVRPCIMYVASDGDRNDSSCISISFFIMELIFNRYLLYVILVWFHSTLQWYFRVGRVGRDSRHIDYVLS